MTAPTMTRTSAYPKAVDELMPAARDLAAELGGLPSRNQLMKALRIGAPKATAVLAALTDEHQDDTEPATARTLRVVPDPTEPETPDPGPVEPTEPDPDAVTESAPPDDDTATEPEPVDWDVVLAKELVATLARKGYTAYEIAPSIKTLYPDVNLADVGLTDDLLNPAPLSLPPVTVGLDPGTTPDAPQRAASGRTMSVWPLWLLALPAIVAIWSGWVGLGELSGFGMVRPLPGIWDTFEINSAITLPIGMEVYAAYALRVWLSGSVPHRARKFARTSALGSLLLGGLGQVAYHLMESAGVTVAPWWITTLVACLPVAVLGMGATLAHLIKDDH